MTVDRPRNTVALYAVSQTEPESSHADTRGAHIGYLHLPTGQIATPAGNWSDPTLNARTGKPSKAHQRRMEAAVEVTAWPA